MSARVVGIANLKGGVGKTTSTILLAEGLSSRINPETGKLNRVLLVDTDPQANLSFSYLGYERLVEVTTAQQNVNSAMVKALMYGLPVSTASMIQNNVSHVSVAFEGSRVKTPISLLSSGPDLIDVERRVIAELTRKERSYRQIADEVLRFVVQDVLAYARQVYDWVLIDCPPGFGLLTQAAVSSCDSTVIVTVPEPLANFGLRLFVNAMYKVPFEGFPIPRNPLVLLSRVIPSQKTHKSICGKIRTNGSDGVYKVMEGEIPETATFNRNSFFGTAITTMKGKYGAHADLVQKLAIELETLVHA